MDLKSGGVFSGKAQPRTRPPEETREPCAAALPVWHWFGEQGNKRANCVQTPTSGSWPLRRQQGSRRGAGQQREEESAFPEHAEVHRYREKF